jgi:UDP-glucose 4-epimerase
MSPWPKRVLVTGGAGYIGSAVATALVDEGHQVVVLDDLSAGHADAVPAGATLITGSVDPDALRATLTHVDAVLHFAARSSVAESVERPELYWETNVVGALRLLGAMVECDAGKLVFSSTAAVYGEPRRLPIDEDAPTEPTNPYGATKLAVDSMIGSFVERYGLTATSLRYFNVAGASNGCGERHAVETHLIPLALEVAAGDRAWIDVYGTDYLTPDGTAVRDYIHLADLVQAHLLALEIGTPGVHSIYNLGNGHGYSVIEVIEAARRVTGEQIPNVAAPRRPGDPAVLLASSSRAERELGWRIEHADIETMIEDAWRFMLRRRAVTGRETAQLPPSPV